jgi:5-methylcytosine-specific restriction endonuclease McrA
MGREPFSHDTVDRIYSRDRKRCKRCGYKPDLISNGNLVIHHIIPVNNGGTNDHDNLVLLCRECHIKTHRELDPSFGRKKRSEWKRKDQTK